ncbi:hypothetical protein BDZ94DRAFT_1268138 [Collybia nuda]|uniref:Uncharacterized protein n=1 Tax=Collybia nuda TaxID=64659 RepID=A0A9P5XX92_9AGAR|nr:hypothetical protein BDZ94DRAFT_1268138 [Collybia nuda]
MGFSHMCVSDITDPNSFGNLPPTPPRSPAVPLSNSAKAFDKSYSHRTSFSDYGHSKCGASDFYAPLHYSPSITQATISPSHISTATLPIVPSSVRVIDEYKGDPRKKYKCAACPRGNSHASLL